MTNTLEDSFVPLTSPAASAGAHNEFRAGPLPGGDSAPAFQAFGQAAVPSSSPPPRKCEPRVSLQNLGPNGQVSGIRVECSCGQIIELECIYQPPPPPPEPVAAVAPVPPVTETSTAAASPAAPSLPSKAASPKGKKKPTATRSRR